MNEFLGRRRKLGAEWLHRVWLDVCVPVLQGSNQVVASVTQHQGLPVS